MKPSEVTITEEKTFSDLRFLSSLWMILSLNVLNMILTCSRTMGTKNIKNTGRFTSFLQTNPIHCNIDSIITYDQMICASGNNPHDDIYTDICIDDSILFSKNFKKRRFQFRMKTISINSWLQERFERVWWNWRHIIECSGSNDGLKSNQWSGEREKWIHVCQSNNQCSSDEFKILNPIQLRTIFFP